MTTAGMTDPTAAVRTFVVSALFVVEADGPEQAVEQVRDSLLAADLRASAFVARDENEKVAIGESQ